MANRVQVTPLPYHVTAEDDLLCLCPHSTLFSPHATFCLEFRLGQYSELAVGGWRFVGDAFDGAVDSGEVLGNDVPDSSTGSCHAADYGCHSAA